MIEAITSVEARSPASPQSHSLYKVGRATRETRGARGYLPGEKTVLALTL